MMRRWFPSSPGNLKKAESIAKWEAEEKPCHTGGPRQNRVRRHLWTHYLCWHCHQRRPPQSFVADTEHALISGLFHAIKEASTIDYHGGSAEQATCSSATTSPGSTCHS